jgi:hypothetical protein
MRLQSPFRKALREAARKEQFRNVIELQECKRDENSEYSEQVDRFLRELEAANRIILSWRSTF